MKLDEQRVPKPINIEDRAGVGKANMIVKRLATLRRNLRLCTRTTGKVL